MCNEVSGDVVKRASTFPIADSGSTRRAVNSKYGMTNFHLLPDHTTVSNVSSEDPKVEGVEDFVVGFRPDSEQKPDATMTRIVSLKDTFRIVHQQLAVVTNHVCRRFRFSWEGTVYHFPWWLATVSSS